MIDGQHQIGMFSDEPLRGVASRLVDPPKASLENEAIFRCWEKVPGAEPRGPKRRRRRRAAPPKAALSKGAPISVKLKSALLQLTSKSL